MPRQSPFDFLPQGQGATLPFTGIYDNFLQPRSDLRTRTTIALLITANACLRTAKSDANYAQKAKWANGVLNPVNANQQSIKPIFSLVDSADIMGGNYTDAQLLQRIAPMLAIDYNTEILANPWIAAIWDADGEGHKQFAIVYNQILVNERVPAPGDIQALHKQIAVAIGICLHEVSLEPDDADHSHRKEWAARLQGSNPIAAIQEEATRMLFRVLVDPSVWGQLPAADSTVLGVVYQILDNYAIPQSVIDNQSLETGFLESAQALAG
jgi:hypothetical protein